MVNGRMVTHSVIRAVVLAVATVSIGGVGICAHAVEARPAKNSKSLAEASNTSAAKTPQPTVDREIEAKSLELVNAHLPELRGVLKRLRADKPREYDRAIRDLAKSARKLEQAKNRDEHLYDIEVESLKAQNQVNLLTATLKVRDRQSDRQRLREAAARLQQAQLARARYDVELYRQRLQRAQQQLDAAQGRLESRDSDPDQQLEKLYQVLLRKAGREPATKKKSEP
jgi:hypothetical protein